MESILTSIKKMLGIAEDYEHFDTDLIIHINTVLSILTQLGVGPSEGFTIRDKTTIWYNFVPSDPKLELIKSYVYMKVKLLFDPPTSAAAIESMTRRIDELEWRINVAAESSNDEGEIQNGE